jgi:hypothetical protein
MHVCMNMSIITKGSPHTACADGVAAVLANVF